MFCKLFLGKANGIRIIIGIHLKQSLDQNAGWGGHAGGGMSKPKVVEFLYQNDCDVNLEHFTQRHSTCLATSFYKKLRLFSPITSLSTSPTVTYGRVFTG